MSDTKKNFLYSASYQILAIILPLITAPYISRILGTEGVGIYSYTYSIVYYFTLFAMLGLNNYGNRQIAKARDDKEKLSKTFSSIYYMQLFLSIIITIVYILYVVFLVDENKDIATIQILYLISTIFDVNWFFWGLEKFKITVTRNTIIKLLTVVAIFTFIKDRGDLYLYVIIMSLGTLISQMLLWPFLRKYTRFTKVSIKDILQHFKPCLILFIPVISVSLYRVMDKIMLGNLTNMDQVGLYENSDKIINVSTAIITALGTVMLPKISNLVVKNETKEEERYFERSIEATFLIASSLMFGIMAVSKTLMPIFLGEEFRAAGDVLKYLAITIIFVAISNIIKSQYLIPHEKEKVYIKATILGAIINFIINFSLIPRLNAIGAVIGTIASECIVSMYQAISIKKDIKVFQYMLKNIKYIILGLIMYICVVIISNVMGETLISLVTQIATGVAIYGIGVVIIYMFKYKEKNLKKLFYLIKKEIF